MSRITSTSATVPPLIKYRLLAHVNGLVYLSKQFRQPGPSKFRRHHDWKGKIQLEIGTDFNNPRLRSEVE